MPGDRTTTYQHLGLNLVELVGHAPTVLAELKRESAKRHLKEFVRQSWSILEPGREFIDGWVVDAICEHLEAVDRGEITRLVITIPPGAMKSRLVRVTFPLWRWIRQPHLKFLGASYALQLAERDNHYARQILLSKWYRDNFGVRISGEQATKVNFDTEGMGGMRAISVGGATTGFRGDCNILDDAHDTNKADSDAVRAEAVRWFLETFQTRVNDLDRSQIIVVGQRVHQEDVPQVAIDLGYEHLNIPMEWDESYRMTTCIGWTDPRVKQGELMWPERFSADALKRLKDALGPYAAAAQLQQDPVPRKGGLFDIESLHAIEDLPSDDDYVYVRGWDLASTQGSGAYTAGVRLAYGKKRRHFYVVDVQRRQLSHAGAVELIQRTAFDDGLGTTIVIPQDPGSAGKVVANEIVADLAGFNVKVEAQSGKKEDRAKPFASQIERGRVSGLKRVWTKSFMDELRFFPRGKYKDQVDAASSAFNTLAPMIRKKDRVPHLVVIGEKADNWAAKV